MSTPVPLHWLSAPRSSDVPVTWGVPWAAGQLQGDTALSLRDAAGNPCPMDSWPSAYYEDGSVMWTTHAAVLDGRQSYSLQTGPARPMSGLSLTETDEGIFIDTGALRCQVAKSGGWFIRQLQGGLFEQPLMGRLICQIATEHTAGTRRVTQVERCAAELFGAEVEQQSAGRCCLKAEGRFSTEEGAIPFLFTLRLYFYAGSSQIKLIHTATCLIEPDTQRLAGLAVEFSVPLSGELFNRQVAFAGDTGLFVDAARSLHANHYEGQRFQQRQQDMQLQSPEARDEKEAWFLAHLPGAAIWRNFRLDQLSPGWYDISKSTCAGGDTTYSRVHALGGRRSKGMLCLHSPAGTVALSVRDFYQKYPMSLEADALDRDAALLRLWLYSDRAAPMHYGSYDGMNHGLEFAYEGNIEEGCDPKGTANTNEITLALFPQFPGKQALWEFAEDMQHTALLLCPPQYYHDSGALGVWALPDYQNPITAKIEQAIEQIERFYQQEVQRRGWYGFYNYGDVMHSYDPIRHQWRYDLGGCAWQNTEFAPNLWLWTSFLRSGKPEIFELARAMTRHTSEVDCYHCGERMGLGSRHNVVHWGCGCKEARIMMAMLHRTYYYLTGDERVGEIMEMAKDADYAAAKKDPMAMYYGAVEGKIHIRTGPDWAAFASNWICHFERTGEQRYLEKIRTGLASITADPIGLLAGPTFLYSPEEGKLHYISDNSYHYDMVVALGGAEVFLELCRHYDPDGKLQKAFADFGKGYAMSDEEIAAFTGGRVADKHEMGATRVLAARLMAYGAAYYRDAALGERAWELLLAATQKLRYQPVPPLESPTPTEECLGLTTNDAAQLALSYYETLALIPEYLPQMR